MSVMTVTGPISEDELGRVLVHEHISVAFAGTELDPRPSISRADRVAKAVERMEELYEFGVRTFVDPCPIELGRDVELMAEVSTRSKVKIVCATGFYHEHDGCGIPYYWRMRWPEEIASLFLSEISGGIAGTGIRPGVIKMATGNPVGRHDRKAITGASLAAAESGLPVITHCQNSVGGDVQQDVLEQSGVNLRRCLIGHQDEQPDLGELKAIAARGSFVGFDRIGMTILAREEDRADRIVELTDAGYVDHLCMSMDHMCFDPGARPAFWIPQAQDRQEEFERNKRPKMDLEFYERPHTYLFTDFLPMLRDRGMTDATIDQILVGNPRRLLAGS